MASIINQLATRATNYNVKTKFILVGIWNTLFGYGIFCLFDTMFAYLVTPRYFAYMSAMVLAQVVAIVNAYIFHRRITFRSKTTGRAIIGEYIRFSATYLFTFCLSCILLPTFVEIGGLHPKIAGAVATVICTIFSYVGHSRFTFK